MPYDHGISYEALTHDILTGIEQSPEVIATVSEETGSRHSAIATLVQLEAPGLFSDTHAGSHVHLPIWHRQLHRHCADEYRLLTEEGNNSDEASQDPHLQDLNAVKEGVHRAVLSEQAARRRRKQQSFYRFALAHS